MDSYGIGFVIGLVIGLILVGVGLIVAYSRQGSVSSTTMGTRRVTLRTAAPPPAVYEWLTQYCPPGYSVDDADPARGIVILSSRPTFSTWGFFYPAHVYQEGSGTRVELGIKSRVFQVGPLVTRAHRKLAHALASLTQSRVEGV